MRTLRLTLGVVGGTLLGLLLGSCQRENAAGTERAAPLVTAPASAPEAEYAPAAPAAARGNWHRLRQRTSRRAPLIRYYPTARPAALDTAGAPPVEASLHELTLKASEFFRIDPSQPAEVLGREGTVVRIPARALVDARQQPANGPVWVELKECYSLADLLLSNHVSVANAGEPQQTGGMLLVRATAKGQPLQLATGTALEVELPADGYQPGLELYYGLARRRQPVRWSPAGPVPVRPAEQVYSRAEPMPVFGSGPADLSRLLRYPDAAAQKGVKGLVLASFVVDEAGQVLEPRIVRGLGRGCDEEALRVLRYTSGRWVPGRRDGQPVKVRLTVPLRFGPDDGLLVSADSAVPVVAEGGEEYKLLAEAPAANPRAFSCGRLGWLSWFKPWAAPTQAAVALPAAIDAQTAVFLVFPGAPAVLQAQSQDSQYVFARVPRGQRAWLVGLRYENGTPFLALRQVSSDELAAAELSFQETTLGDLETALARLR
ncbi:TonB family protein [Hymenobacter sp. B81]|uniref:TonB family protein n=1 Tax=Hymenobacter sp. B81 TaxID=3344878 RepID=UPI0037DC10AD